MVSSDSVSSDQYPKSDRNDDLEELSFKALRNILPVQRFVFRDERGKDKGVDGSLEVKIDSGFTNLRAQVQLKGTDSEEVNADGSVSLQVNVRNLNYLINGPSPIYILYVASRDELRFVWAREEYDRLNQTNPNWTRQETVTIRFRDILTSDALDHIHDQIRREAQLHRRIHDILGRASGNERVVTSIDPTTLTNTDPDEVYQLLLTSGTTIVSAGYALQVKDLLGFLNPDAAQSPRIHLIRAFMEYTLGRYQLALGHVAETSLHLDELSIEDQQFLTYIHDACEYQIGRISLSELAERIETRIRQSIGVFSIIDRLNQRRVTLLAEPDVERRSVMLKELRSVVDEILVIPDVAESFKLLARLILFEAEGHQSIFKSYADLAHSNFVRTLGRAVSPEEVLQAQTEQYERWERDLNATLQDAIATNHPLITADALLVRTVVKVAYFTNFQLLALMFGVSVKLSEKVLHGAMQDTEQAMNIHAQAGQLEGELRAKLLLAELFGFAGQDSAACELANNVLPKARAMNYVIHIAHAREIISGQSLLNRVKAKVSAGLSEDPDYSMATDPEEVLRKFASESFNVLELPVERLPNLELEIFALRDIARERLSWCRHIDLLHDLSHTRHPSTHYSRPPTHYCICRKFKYDPKQGNEDWKIVISAFKDRYCAGCPARSPKRQRD